MGTVFRLKDRLDLDEQPTQPNAGQRSVSNSLPPPPSRLNRRQPK